LEVVVYDLIELQFRTPGIRHYEYWCH